LSWVFFRELKKFWEVVKMDKEVLDILAELADKGEDVNAILKEVKNVKEKMAKIDREIEEIDKKINELREKKQALVEKKQAIVEKSKLPEEIKERLTVKTVKRSGSNGKRNKYTVITPDGRKLKLKDAYYELFPERRGKSYKYEDMIKALEKNGYRVEIEE